MLHVIRHYLPLRKGLLVLSESVLITLVVLGAMSAHLWRVTPEIRRALAIENLDPQAAIWRCFFSAVLVAVLAQITISFNELYDFRVSRSPYERAARFLGSAGSAILLVTATLAVFALWDVGRPLSFPGLSFNQAVVMLTVSLILAFALLYVWRNVFHSLLRRSRFNERLLILGSGRLAHRLADDLRRREGSGYEIAAVVSPTAPPGGGAADEPDPGGSGSGNLWYETPIPGTLSLEDGFGVGTAVATKRVLEGDLAALEGAPLEEGEAAEAGVETVEPLAVLAKRLRVDDIVVAFEERRGALPTEELLRCRLEGIVVEEAEAFFERLTGKIPAEAMRPSYLIFNPGFLQRPLSQLLKRTLDIVLSLVGILATLPVMLAAAIAVRYDSPGPALFRQRRTGRYGRPFTLLKFRSMHAHAERETGPVWASEEDPRITRVGRFLRSTRIDELPQLFNVLAGSMSLVGPRPERPSFVTDLAQQIPYYNQRHIVRPGITGWAQINYPYGNTIEDALQKLQYDLFYIKYQSSIFDFSILFNTIKTVILRKGT